MLTGKELKVRRIILDIKAVEVAEVLGIHKSYVSKMEREVQAIPLHMRMKWEEYLGINNK